MSEPTEINDNLPRPMESDEDQTPEVVDFRSLPITARQKRFLDSYSQHGFIAKAADQAHVHRIAHYRWLKESTVYQQAFNFAKQLFRDWAEGICRNTGFVGEEHVITRKLADGSIVTDRYNKKSENLMMFCMKFLDPGYRDTAQVIQATGPIQVAIKIGNQEMVVGNKSTT